MGQSQAIVFQALRRSMLGILVFLIIIGLIAFWGLWAQGRSLDRIAHQAGSGYTTLEEIHDGLSRVQLALLQWSRGTGADGLGAALESVEKSLSSLQGTHPRATELASEFSILRTDVEAVTRTAYELPRSVGARALELAPLLERLLAFDQRSTRLVEQALETEIGEGMRLAALARRLRFWVVVGLLVGGGLLTATVVFSFRRLQGPFEDVLQFMRLAGEKDLSGRLSASSEDELGDLAKAATQLSGTLVETIGSLRRVAGEARNRGTTLEIGAVQARQGAEDQLERAKAGAERARSIEAELKPLVEQSRKLRTGAEQAAASVEQILAMTEEVRAEMEGITERVTNSTQSVENLSEATTRVASLAGQMGSAAQSVAAAASAIDQATHTLSSGASEGRHLTEVVVEKASEGRDSMAVALRAMERIREAVDAAVQSFDRLEAELGRVGRVTQVIDDIAGRTNLLSLNAAIIAAQSGEQGKAFGVVATEIRSLAEKTARSTREIRTVVGGLVSGGREASQAISAGAERVVEGERLARNTGELLKTIFGSADDAARRLAEVEEAAAGQSHEVARVAEEIRQVSEGVNGMVQEVQEQEVRAREIHGDLVEIEQVARQTARAADEQTRGTQLITHTMVDVSDVSEKVDDSIAAVGELLTRLREDLEAMGAQARKELTRIADIEVEGEGLAALAGQIQVETSGFRLPEEGPTPESSEQPEAADLDLSALVS